MGYDVNELKEAAARLARQEDAKAHYDILDQVLTKAGTLPVKLYDTPAMWLNPMLYAYKTEPDTYKTLVQWANRKRVERGLTPILTDKTLFDKGEYQREFMAAKRERERRAVQAENSRRPERDALKGRAREDFQRRLAAEWQAEKDRMLDAARNAKGGKRLTKEEAKEVMALFWEAVDQRIGASEFRPRTALREALEHDPYA
jgi:hypothetical protein